MTNKASSMRYIHRESPSMEAIELQREVNTRTTHELLAKKE